MSSERQVKDNYAFQSESNNLNFLTFNSSLVKTQKQFLYVVLTLVSYLVIHLLTQHNVMCRGKWGKVKQNFSSVSQGVYIANMVTFMDWI